MITYTFFDIPHVLDKAFRASMHEHYLARVEKLEAAGLKYSQEWYYVKNRCRFYAG